MLNYENRQKNFDKYISQKTNEILELNIPAEEKEKLYSLLRETIKRNIEITESYANGMKNAAELEKSQKKLEDILSGLLSTSREALAKYEESKSMLEQKGKLLN